MPDFLPLLHTSTALCAHSNFRSFSGAQNAFAKQKQEFKNAFHISICNAHASESTEIKVAICCIFYYSWCRYCLSVAENWLFHLFTLHLRFITDSYCSFTCCSYCGCCCCLHFTLFNFVPSMCFVMRKSTSSCRSSYFVFAQHWRFACHCGFVSIHLWRRLQLLSGTWCACVRSVLAAFIISSLHVAFCNAIFVCKQSGKFHQNNMSSGDILLAILRTRSINKAKQSMHSGINETEWQLIMSKKSTRLSATV